MRRLFVATLSLLVAPSLALAVCAGGSAVGGSCTGVPSAGCCTLYDDNYDFVELLTWCDGGTLCQRDCEASGLYCGISSDTGQVTCGDLMDVSTYDDNYDSVECTSTPTGGGGSTEPSGTGTGQPCGSVGYEGCCDGQTLTWCEGGEIRIIDCSEAPSCGWNEADGFYNCGTNGGEDPYGYYPINCDGTSGGGTTGQSCGSVTYEGCCDGNTVTWCEGGTLATVNCATEPDSPGPSCGWDDVGGYYWCGYTTAADPSGNAPYACGPCTPSCTGKACGSDGCGGSCGTCATGTSCQAFQCKACSPSCTGKACGDDGCGGSCGTCASNQDCVSGTCITSQTCAPSCKRADGSQKECGDNGCGGMCGGCGIGKVCDASGACVEPGTSGVCDPACGNKECGPDACGGTCGACEAGKGCYEGFCVTGIACTPDCEGRECGPDGCDGTCGTCRTGYTCGTASTCVVDTTAGNGGTGDVCPAGQVRFGGVCVSEEGDSDRTPVNDAVDTGSAGDGSGCTAGGPAPSAALSLLMALSLLALRRRVA
jgi:hypothetical protein